MLAFALFVNSMRHLLLQNPSQNMPCDFPIGDQLSSWESSISTTSSQTPKAMSL